MRARRDGDPPRHPRRQLRDAGHRPLRPGHAGDRERGPPPRRRRRAPQAAGAGRPRARVRLLDEGGRMTETLLDRVFAPGGITARFQPVVDVSRNPVACTYLEGLVRGPAGTNLERADVLFSYIRRRRESARMDRLCVAAVLDAARALPADVAVGFNVDAATLTADAQFPEWVRTAAASRELALSRLVVEIVEHTWPWDLHTFHAATGALRDMGVRLALDD